jgi:thioredoxin-related protein
MNRLTTIRAAVQSFALYTSVPCRLSSRLSMLFSMLFSMRFVISALFMLLAIVAVPVSSNAQLLGSLDTAKAHKSDLPWHSIREGLTLAAKQNKPLVVDFYTDWCGWCKVMDQKTYEQYQIKDMLKAGFVLAKYNPEKDGAFEYRGKKVTPIEFSKLVGVNGYPTTAFLKADGTKIDAVSGYIEFTRFLEMLRFVDSKKYETANVRLEEYMIQQNIDRDPNNASFRLSLAQYYTDSAHYGKALEIFQYVAMMQPKNRDDLFALHQGWGSAQYFFAKDYKSASKNLQKSLDYTNEPQSKARTMLLLAFSEAGDKQAHSSVEHLEQFVKYCKEKKLTTDGLRKMFEQTPQLEPVRSSKEFAKFIATLPPQ